MSKFNYYEKKLRILEQFYMWIEQGSTYHIAEGQSSAYLNPSSELEELLYPIVIARRFARIDKPIHSAFRNELEVILARFKSLDLEPYELSDDELKELKSELEEIKGFLLRLKSSN